MPYPTCHFVGAGLHVTTLTAQTSNRRFMPNRRIARSDIQRLKDEYDELTAQQARALLDAVYLGMARDVAEACEKRRQRLAELFQALYDRLPGGK